ELLVATTRDSPGGIRLLTLGPLTNVAMALDVDAELAGRLESIWIMGGAVQVAGNVAGSPGADTDNTAAEWNIYADPAAAQRVLESSIPIHLISLDGTNQVPVTRAFADRVRSASGTGPGLGVLQELFAENSYMVSGSSYLWDPLAAIFATGYEIGAFTETRVEVDTGEGPTSGATRQVDGDPNVSYLSQAESAAAEAILLQVLAGQ
ncbi:MAG TPA: nucleoside hydrolase, partial [Candidatus Limnocylindria bacterium]|nr:nucleoside hydrolase [Candidatus Limnocylindria bacterium]